MHVLARYPSDLSHADMLRHLKARSSKWVNETFQSMPFGWQEGYGGFTVSRSKVEEVDDDIVRQREHHARIDFQTEFMELLRRHGCEFDPNEVFD